MDSNIIQLKPIGLISSIPYSEITFDEILDTSIFKGHGLVSIFGEDISISTERGYIVIAMTKYKDLLSFHSSSNLNA